MPFRETVRIPVVIRPVDSYYADRHKICRSDSHVEPTIPNTMRRSSWLLALLFTFLIMTGCATTGAYNTANLTEVQLSEANYEVVATNVKGEASAGYVIGVSGGVYRQMQTIALFRVSGSGMIYGDALKNLWDNFRKKHGETKNRDLALVNVRYDTEALNLLVYTKPTVAVRADVVEFTE